MNDEDNNCLNTNMYKNSISGSIWTYIANALDHYDPYVAAVIAAVVADVIDEFGPKELLSVEEFMINNNVPMINCTLPENRNI